MRRLVSILGAAMLVAVSCSSSSTPGGGASSSPSASETPQQGGRVIEATISDIATMQPVLVNDTASQRITQLLYDDLIQVDYKTGEPQPRLATFSISTDSLKYTFTIDPKAVWSDGKPVIADDWLTGLKAVGKSKKTVRKSTFQDVLGFKAYSDGTATTIPGVAIDSANPKKFTVTMAKVSCSAIIDLTGYVLPTQVFGKYVTDTSKDEIDSAPENTAPTVVSGPFKLNEWRKGDQVILDKNPTYWQGPANLDQYVYKVVANQTAITNGLKTGEITFGTIQAKDLADVQTVSTVKIDKYQNLGYTFIGWNTASPTAVGLADKRVRQALAYGIDMDQVIKAVVFGEATKQVAHHVPVQWAYPTGVALEQYKYDKAKALSLLKDAGWTPGSDGILQNAAGKKFNLTISTNSGNTERETLATVAAEQYKQLGINAKAAPEAFQGLVTKLTTGDSTLEATIIGWSLGAEPDPYQIWHSSQIPDTAKNVQGFGFTFFKDPAMDKAIEEARNPSNGDCSIAARKKQYETFNKILNENQPYNFGYANNVLAVSQNTLQNFRPGSFRTVYNVYQWWIKK
ncbi:MAG: peptide/nickel transport system substrate-binding protein [Chloroflexota bacterium]|nr:peptide/nickel transport system substrate-binding protein [Chloroflexota bacterium]